jgi:hypothetical protein
MHLGEVLNCTVKRGVFSVSGDVLTLPETVRCTAILRCFATKGISTGYKTFSAAKEAPTSGNVGINPVGNPRFASSDGVTEAQLIWVAQEGPIFEDIVPISSNLGTFLNGRYAGIPLQVVSLTGTLKAEMAIVERGTIPTTGQVSLSTDARSIVFAAADAVSLARIRYSDFPIQNSSYLFETTKLGI